MQICEAMSMKFGVCDYVGPMTRVPIFTLLGIVAAAGRRGEI